MELEFGAIIESTNGEEEVRRQHISSLYSYVNRMPPKLVKGDKIKRSPPEICHFERKGRNMNHLKIMTASDASSNNGRSASDRQTTKGKCQTNASKKAWLSRTRMRYGGIRIARLPGYSSAPTA